jgi:hypothetical protein
VGDQVVVSLGVEAIERAKQFFCDGLGFELERTQGPFSAFKESHGGPLALYSGAPRDKRRAALPPGPLTAKQPDDQRR